MLSKRRRIFAYLGIFCFVVCMLGFPWLYSSIIHGWIDEEFAQSKANLPKVSDISLRSYMIDELEKRASYFYYQGLKSEFETFLKQRYHARRAQIRWGRFKPQRDLIWTESETGPVLSGTLVQRNFRLNLELPWTVHWLADSLSFVSDSTQGKSPATQSFILEGEHPSLPERDLEHLRDHASLLAKFQILKLEPMAYQGERWVESPIHIHRVVAVDKKVLRKRFLRKSLTLAGWILLLGLITLVFVALFQLSFPLIYRVLGFQALVWVFLFLCLNQESNEYLHKKTLSREHQREIELLSSENSKKLDLRMPQLRSLLPLSEEAVYTLEQNSELLVFRAIHEGLWGMSFAIEPRARDMQWLWFFLILSLAVGLILWFSRPFSEFFRFEGERIKAWIQGHSPPRAKSVRCQSLQDRAILQLKSKIDNLEMVLEARQVRRKSFSHPIHDFLRDYPDLDPGKQPLLIPGVGLLIAPLEPEFFLNASCRDYFEPLNRMIAELRSIGSRHQAVSFLDQNWTQGLFFSQQQGPVLRQRAMVCGLELIQALQGLTESPFLAVIQEGELNLSLVRAGGREEFLQEGTLLASLQSQFSVLLENSVGPGLYIAKELALKGPSFFDLEDLQDLKISAVRGLKDLSQHLALLHSGDADLQRGVLDLIRLGTEPAILDEILGGFPDFSLEVQQQALAVFENKMTDSAARQRLLTLLPEWARDQRVDGLQKILEIYERLAGGLTRIEVNTLLALGYPELEDRILRLVLERSNEALDSGTLERVSGADSPEIQALLALEEFLQRGTTASLDKVLSILEAADSREKHQILKDFQNLDSSLKTSSQQRKILGQWTSSQAGRLRVLFRNCLRDQDSALVLTALQNIAFLRPQGFTEELIQEFQKCPIPEIRSQCIKTLKDLGADTFLMTALI